MVSASAIQPGRLHKFSKRLVAFEYKTPSGEEAQNLLLWVGGLGDGLFTVSYPALLSQLLPPDWSLAQAVLLSSYNGWGTRSLQSDVHEIGQCVDYFRKLRTNGKVVLMGHSTGCQDAMEYISGRGKGDRPKIDGVILQAPVSDREAMAVESKTKHSDEEYDLIISTSKEWVRSGKGDDVLPKSVAAPFLGQTPTTAYRCLSLLSPDHDGDDDFFSSDLSDTKLRSTFGAFKKQTPLLVLFSGADQHVPSFIDKEALVARWSKIVKGGGGVVDEKYGGVIHGAHHNLEEDDDEIFQDLRRRVAGFLWKTVSGEVDTEAHL